MKNFRFDDEATIKTMIDNNYVDESNYKITIDELTLYNYYVLHLSQDDNYNAVVKYMLDNSREFYEAMYSQFIVNKISSLYSKRKNKRLFRHISSVDITQHEMDVISSLEDIKQRKVAFVLLAVAKYNDAIRSDKNHYANLTNLEICKLARVTLSKDVRSQFMGFIYSKGIVEYSYSASSDGKKVKFISEDPNDSVVLSLNELDFKELAYSYLSWEQHGKGFKHCKCCGRLIKLYKNKEYCEECSKNMQKPVQQYKTIVCSDCGKEFVVDTKNNKTYRCDDCQHESDKAVKREYWKHISLD